MCWIGVSLVTFERLACASSQCQSSDQLILQSWMARAEKNVLCLLLAFQVLHGHDFVLRAGEQALREPPNALAVLPLEDFETCSEQGQDCCVKAARVASTAP